MIIKLHDLKQRTLVSFFIITSICMLSYIYFDRALAIFLANQKIQNDILIKISNLISIAFDPGNWFIITVILIVFYFWKRKQKLKLKILIVIVLLDLILSIILTIIAKMIFARCRPELFLMNGLYGFHYFSNQHCFNSFPSGHVTVGFSGLLGLSHCFRYRIFDLLCIIIATAIAFSRIIISQHYFSDILIGSSIALLIHSLSKIIAVKNWRII